MVHAMLIRYVNRLIEACTKTVSQLLMPFVFLGALFGWRALREREGGNWKRAEKALPHPAGYAL